MNLSKEKFLTTITFIGSGLLAGCTGGDISLVKESRMKGWPDYTIGQMLDKRKACSKTEWKSFKDERDRVIVEYTCVHEPGTNYIQKANAEELKAERNKPSIAEISETEKKELAEKKQQITVAQQDLQDHLENGGSQEKVASLKERVAYYESGYLRLKKSAEEYAQIVHKNHVERLALIERRAANFQEINEVFQWVIQEENPVFLVSQIKVVFSDKAYGVPIDMATMFNLAAENSYEISSGYKRAIADLVDDYGKKSS